MVIAVDAGNKQIKSEHFDFHSGLQESEQVPQTAEKALLYKGKYYVPSSRRIRYLRDKTEDDRFYILTLIAVAKEIERAAGNGMKRFQEDSVTEVDLLVDLPPAHYPELYEKFEQYFYRGGEPVVFSYGDKEYIVHFRSVTAYPQAYMAFLWVNSSRSLMKASKVLVVDIGGFTSDYLLIRQGVPDLTFCDSLEKGIILMYNGIIARVRQKYDVLLEETDVDSILRGQQVYCSDRIQEEVAGMAEEYVTEFLGGFRELEIDFATTYTVFTGGGAVLLGKLIDRAFRKYHGQYCIEPDIHANAKGCRIQYLADLE